MDKLQLYQNITDRKIKPEDFEPYKGTNGRVNKALQLYKSGKLKSGGLHIDVGGAIGDLGYALRQEKLFEKTLTVDIAAKNLEAARAKGNYILLCDMDRDGFNVSDPSCFAGPHDWTADIFWLNGASKVDAISALDFIEHIIDPVNFAKGCYGMLKPGGEVFINTPNIEYFDHLRELVMEGKFPHTSGDKEVYHGGHLAFFTYSDLRDIFSQAGFTSFEQFKDDEGYRQPPEFWINLKTPRNQTQYMEACMRLGNPNLLFKATRPL